MKENPKFEITVRYFVWFLAVVFFLGLVLDGFLIAWKIQGRTIPRAPPQRKEIHWTFLDIVRVFILLTTLIYLIVWIQNAIIKYYRIEQSEDFRILFTTSAMDIFAFIFVVYFVIHKRGQSFGVLGLSRKRIIPNIFLGIIGYMCALPIVLCVNGIIFVLVYLLGYSPSVQKIIVMFFHQENMAVVGYMIFLTLFLGPIIEEIFFRGFIYPVLRNKVGIPMAIFFTSFIFSFLHFKFIIFFHLLILGIILAYVYEKTDSLIAPITLHIIHNSMMIAFLFIVKLYL